MRQLSRNFFVLLIPALLALAGCAGGAGAGSFGNAALSIAPHSRSVDTNCTGCNASKAGVPVEQFTATLASGGAAEVTWSVSGGDAVGGPGSISASGQYTPPSYLTADRAGVVVTAALAANPSVRANSALTITPGFLEPLTPENAAVGAHGSVAITGFLAEAGGSAGIRFELSGSPAGQAGTQSGTPSGELSAVRCQRGSRAFTSCTVTYTAPAAVPATSATYVVATVDASSSKESTAVLVNSAGIASNAATHQASLPESVALGSSGGNNTNYDTRGDQIVDCCSGTLGALIEDAGRREYVLSNNHVLARSDQASVGDAIVQPGLIDNNCSPFGDSAGLGSTSSIKHT